MKKLVILFYGLIIFAVVFSLLAMPSPALAQVTVEVDIKPGSCPSSINLKKKGVTPVAIVGTVDLDFETINLNSITLEGVSAKAYDIIDTTQPNTSDDPDPCYNCFAADDPANFNCDLDGDGINDAYCGDGIMDLILYFPTPDLADALVEPTECMELTLTGVTSGGDVISGTDYARIKGY